MRFGAVMILRQTLSGNLDRCFLRLGQNFSNNKEDPELSSLKQTIFWLGLKIFENPWNVHDMLESVCGSRHVGVGRVQGWESVCVEVGHHNVPWRSQRFKKITEKAMS